MNCYMAKASKTKILWKNNPTTSSIEVGGSNSPSNRFRPVIYRSISTPTHSRGHSVTGVPCDFLERLLICNEML